MRVRETSMQKGQVERPTTTSLHMALHVKGARWLFVCLRWGELLAAGLPCRIVGRGRPAAGQHSKPEGPRIGREIMPHCFGHSGLKSLIRWPAPGSLVLGCCGSNLLCRGGARVSLQAGGDGGAGSGAVGGAVRALRQACGGGSGGDKGIFGEHFPRTTPCSLPLLRKCLPRWRWRARRRP